MKWIQEKSFHYTKGTVSYAMVLTDIKKATLSVSMGMKDKDGKMLMAPFDRKLKPAEIVALVKYLEKFSKHQKDS
jgi:hypothetical protein